MKRITIDGKEFELVPVKSKLEEARERYPIGTKFKSVKTNMINVADREPHFYNDLTDSIAVCEEFGEVYIDGVWAEIVTETFPTMDEIIDSVLGKDYNGANDPNNIIFLDKLREMLPSESDENYVLSVIELIVIATYYNAMFPDEVKNTYIYLHKDSNEDFNTQLISERRKEGNILFTPSAAKEALKNPNVVEVLKKYFRIK